MVSRLETLRLRNEGLSDEISVGLSNAHALKWSRDLFVQGNICRFWGISPARRSFTFGRVTRNYPKIGV